MDPADPLLPKILVLVILILINAFFAAAEIAVISLSETKLRKQAEEGDKKAKKLLVLMQAPDSFLSAIQIAITLAGFLSSAFAADSFSDPLVHWLTVDKGFTAIPTSTLNTIMVVLITIVLSYFSLVLGELVPKRIAMKKTEAVARFTVGAVTSVAAVFRPVIWLLSKSTNGVLRLLHIDPKADEEDVSEDEIRMMVDLGEERGAIESNEKELIDNIFEFNNTTAEDVMIHRTDMVMLWVEDTREEILATIRSSGLSASRSTRRTRTISSAFSPRASICSTRRRRRPSPCVSCCAPRISCPSPCARTCCSAICRARRCTCPSWWTSTAARAAW